MMKIIRIFLLILILIGIGLLATQKYWVPKLVDHITSSDSQTVVTTPVSVSVPITITTKKIEEKNFTGTVPVISGTSILAVKMRAYVAEQVDAFRTQADTDVPQLRITFGSDTPPANYSINIDSKYIKNENTESIVTEVYTYTGGAHGISIYKVITVDRASQNILSLSDVISPEQQKAFTTEVKKELNDWRPAGSDASVVFPEDVQGLTFDSFTNWSVDNNNLTIYFDQYAVGPGVLGAVAFPVPHAKIDAFLISKYR